MFPIKSTYTTYEDNSLVDRRTHKNPTMATHSYYATININNKELLTNFIYDCPLKFYEKQVSLEVHYGMSIPTIIEVRRTSQNSGIKWIRFLPAPLCDGNADHVARRTISVKSSYENQSISFTSSLETTGRNKLKPFILRVGTSSPPHQPINRLGAPPTRLNVRIVIISPET